MKIIVNDKELEVSGQRVLIDELREAGCDIPSLCYASGANHQASCMVCMVRNVANDQMLPSCSTYPVEGMHIDTESDDVKALRRMSFELLLSDHRADCEAPCSMVCPAGIDLARLILLYDRGQMAEAKALLASQTDINNLPCADCKGGCEKVCRRGTVDKCVDIKNIIKEISVYTHTTSQPYNHITLKPRNLKTLYHTTPQGFSSKLGRFTEAEKAWLKEVYTQPSRCLHCACEGQDKCKLRTYASQAGIKSSRYGVASRQIAKEQQHIVGRLYFEPAKCVRCGLCVYNSQDGFTLQHRGFDMQVVIPEQSRWHVDEHLARLCPTGALFIKTK